MIDLHSHILPGVDDGAPDLDVALDMLTVAVEDGITAIAATPHFIPGSFAPPGPQVLEGVAALREAAKKRGLVIEIHPGHEVRAAAGLVDRIRTGEVLALDRRGRYLLLEMPGSQVPEWMDQLVFELEVAGITAVIAHPERNTGIIRNPMRLHALIERGCRTQVTAGSLLGHFGKHAAETSRLLLACDMVHVVASDAHDARFRTPSLTAARAVVEEAVGAGVGETLFVTNPRAILAGEDFPAPDPMTPDQRAWNGAEEESKDDGGLWGRLREMFRQDE